MGRHSIEKKDNSKKIILNLIVLILIAVVVSSLFVIIRKQIINRTTEEMEIYLATTIPNEKLVLKSNFSADYNKRTLFYFTDNRLVKIEIIEELENDEIYNQKKEDYSKTEDINILKLDDKNRTIYYQKLNLGSDDNLTYDEIYNKYMSIIGAYEIL